ncbi:MAG: DNA polymerase I [Candidatus Omnitrophota bacterium]|nr:DNA polymerase I [Candidatus Omnitrophota bacterium]
MSKVFLIDGTAFCYRAFYAIRNLSTSDGRPTNAVYGFAVMLQALRDKEQPTHLGVAFDVGKPTFRHKRFEEYKGQRKPMPEPLIGQIPLIKALLAAYRIPIFEQEGYEGEDVLATMASQIAPGGAEVFLVTGDKDALQLVNSHIKVYNPHQEGTILDAASVQARYGVGPEHMVDLMALMGDAIDNIPGVPGIGEHTARQLLARFGTLDALYARLDEVESPARRKTLEACREQVELSRELARIDRHVSLHVTLDDLKVQEPDWRALRTLLRELEFKRLLHAVEQQAPMSHATAVTHPVLTERDLTALGKALAAHATTQRASALVCWPLGTPIRAAMLAVAIDPEAAWVVRIDETLPQTPPGQRLAAWLADPAIPKLSHDAKTAKRILGRLGLPLNGIAGDTMIAAYLLNPARTAQSLNDLSAEQMDQPLSPVPSLEETAAPSDPFGPSACAVWRLHERLLPALEAQELKALYTELELPLLEVLAAMEAHGIAVDLPYLASLHASMDAQLKQLCEELYRLAGCSFNLNSPKQLAQVLFGHLGLPVVKRTKTGPSTDSSVLQQLAQRHPFPQTLMHYRELSKLVSTYVDALPQLVNPATGRLHTSFNQAATATGRLSSSEPNLQNIPIKTELGRSIRKAFVAEAPEGVLVTADYSQIELRILAHLSHDARLIEAFHDDRDIHCVTASLIYGCPEAEVQPQQRQAMKAVNYGILYGMSAHGLSNELGIPFEEAQVFIEAYFERYPTIRDYLDRQIAQARRDGFVQTLLGRRRYIPEVNSPDPVVRQFGERMAINAPIQGTAADLIKRAMVQLAGELTGQRLSSLMVVQVHDELVFEAPRRELDRLVPLVRRVMEGAMTLDVPLRVTLKHGPNWLDLTALE